MLYIIASQVGYETPKAGLMLALGGAAVRNIPAAVLGDPHCGKKFEASVYPLPF